MSDKITTGDIMSELHALRNDLKKQGSDLHRLADQHNEHERRIKALEPLKDSYRDLLECNINIVKELNEIKETQRTLVNTMAIQVEGALRGDLLDLRKELRTDMVQLHISAGALTEAQQQLATILMERPCVVGDSDRCPRCGEEKGK